MRETVFLYGLKKHSFSNFNGSIKQKLETAPFPVEVVLTYDDSDSFFCPSEWSGLVWGIMRVENFYWSFEDCRAMKYII